MINTRDAKSNKLQKHFKYFSCRYYIQDIKHVQHKNVNMSWDYWKFPCHPVASKRFEMRESHTILFRYHYKVDTNLDRGFCVISRFPCAFPSCFTQLDKDWLPNCALSYQPSYVCDENCYYKILENYNGWIIMGSLYNKTTQ